MIYYRDNNDGESYKEIANQFFEKLMIKPIPTNLSGINPELIYRPESPQIHLYKYSNDLSISHNKRSFIEEFTNNDFDFLNKIIKATPIELYNYSKQVEKDFVKFKLDKLPRKQRTTLKDSFLGLMGYSRFDKLIGRKWFFDKLDIPVCAYCNDELLFEVDNKDHSKKILLMEIDHYLMKSKHPMLSLSFFNLVPSCGKCNNKLLKPIDKNPKTHLHPYKDSFHQKAVFHFNPKPKLFPAKISIELIDRKENIKDKKRTTKTIKDYRFNDLYKHYEKEVVQLLFHFKNSQSKWKKRKFADFFTTEFGFKVNQNSTVRINKYKSSAGIPTIENEIRLNRQGKLKMDLFEELNK